MTNTQKQRMADWYMQWLNSSATELWQVYSRHSTAKQMSYDRIKAKMKDQEGHDLRIMGHNSDRYTCAWWSGYGEDAEFVVETAVNQYRISKKDLSHFVGGKVYAE